MNYIFDFDGTLMDTSRVILSTIKATIKEMGLPDKTTDQCRSIIGIRTDEAGKHLYPDLDISNAEFASTFRRNYQQIKNNANEQTYPQVIETLRTIKANGHRMAIASSRRLDSLNDYLDGLGITDWFDMIVGADSVTNGKPDPEPVETILKAKGWLPQNTLVVGDSDVDIKMGKAAHCKTCAVTYGNGTLAALQAAAPDNIIHTFPQLLNLHVLG